MQTNQTHGERSGAPACRVLINSESNTNACNVERIQKHCSAFLKEKRSFVFDNRYFMNFSKITLPAITHFTKSSVSLFYAFFIMVFSSYGQILTTSEGETTFYAEAPAPATDVSAITKKTRISINKETGQVSVRINMKDFVLPKTLMQKHYNEKYMETDKFPTSTFEGKMSSVPDFSKNGTYDVTATGNLLVHGVTKKRTITGKITVKDGTATLSSEFDVKLADHNVTIPVIFFMKITESVKVKATYIFKG